MTANPHTSRVYRADPGSLDRHETHHRGGFTTCHSSNGTLLVTVSGEVDATNHRALAGYIERQLVDCRHLRLDLRLVDFFGTAGFAALHNINVICSRSGVTWEMRAGRQVRRLLNICDPDGVLPLEAPQSVLDDLDATLPA
jgi:anti-anti-sigma factor